MTQEPTFFKCIVPNDENLILSATEIVSIVPVKDYKDDAYIKIVYEDDEFGVNTSVICKKIEIYTIV
jgi:hypothetical protein